MTADVSRHAACERLTRHRHAAPYVAVVLDGGYVEAGSGARLRAEAGDVIVHHAWEAHQNSFAAKGARVLNLPLPVEAAAANGRIADTGLIVRIAARDPHEASEAVCAGLTPPRAALGDWPDLLAEALSGEDGVGLAGWADRIGVSPSSLSRSFGQAYGVSPKRYRLEQRTVRALRALPLWRGSLAGLAAESGFADQAHMTRAVFALTGRTPRAIRVQSVQERRAASR